MVVAAIDRCRVHGQTAVRTEGITGQFRRRPAVKAEVDDG